MSEAAPACIFDAIQGRCLAAEAGERSRRWPTRWALRRKLLYEWRDGLSGAGRGRIEPQARAKAGWQEAAFAAGPRLVRRAASSDAAPSAARPRGRTSKPKAEARIAELERVIGRQQADLHFFREALRLWDATSPKRRRAHLYAVIEKMTALEPQGYIQDDANIQRLCALGGVSRAGYYRHFGPMPRPATTRTCAISSSASRSPTAITAIGASPALRRQGLIVNAKRVLRLMREDNLLVPARQAVRSAHDRQPAWLRDRAQPDARPEADRPRSDLGRRHHLCPARRGLRLSRGRASTRSRARWWAGRSTIIWRPAGDRGARHGARRARNPAPDSLIHHSDRGVQYACGDYIERLEARRSPSA